MKIKQELHFNNSNSKCYCSNNNKLQLNNCINNNNNNYSKYNNNNWNRLSKSNNKNRMMLECCWLKWKFRKNKEKRILKKRNKKNSQ